MGPKCNLPMERRPEVLSLFHDGLSENEEATVREMFPQYLFFYNMQADDGWDQIGGPVRVCFCTACRQSFEAVRGNYAKGKLHRERCNCPACGREVTGQAVYRFKYDMRSLTSWVKICTVRVAPDGALLIQGGEAHRTFTWDDLEGIISWYPTTRCYIAPDGTRQAWRLNYTDPWCGGATRRAWHPMKTMPEPTQPQPFQGYFGEYVAVGLAEALAKASGFKYCQIADFFYYEFSADVLDPLSKNAAARWIVQYLAWYAQFPQIEMAVKLGLGDAVCELVRDGKQNVRLLNWRAKKPSAFLRMSAQDASFFLSRNMDFQDLKIWRECGGKTSLRSFWALIDEAGGKANMLELAKAASAADVSIEKALRYVQSLMPPCVRMRPSPGLIIQTWLDYLRMARELGYDLTEKTVVMPKDLQERHDAAAELKRYKAVEKEEKKYKKRRAQLEKRFAFEMAGLCVVVPKDSREIVEEGKTLKHCVGGYAARHLRGEVTILFLRKIRKREKSFLTIELCEERGKWKIRQIHGYRNENYPSGRGTAPSEKYAWFLDAWLGWVNAGSERDRNGQPVQNEKQEVKTA